MEADWRGAGSPPRRRRSAKWRRLFTAALSVAGHLGVLFAVLSARTDAPRVFEPEPMQVELVEPRPVFEAPAPTPPTPAPPSPAPPTPAPPAPAKPLPKQHIAVRPRPAPPDVATVPASEDSAVYEPPQLSDAQIASAATVGSGRAGGACDMARRLQAALRKDARVQAAVAVADRAEGSAGKPMLVWNGDWIRSRGEDGNGLAAVREAMMWEIAFAPEACRAEPVHGLVLFSLNDAPGSARLVVGSGQWRWSDLLRPRPHPALSG